MIGEGRGYADSTLFSVISSGVDWNQEGKGDRFFQRCRNLGFGPSRLFFPIWRKSWASLSWLPSLGQLSFCFAFSGMSSNYSRLIHCSPVGANRILTGFILVRNFGAYLGPVMHVI